MAQAHPGKQVLVAANTNIAVDNIALALVQAGVKVVLTLTLTLP